MRFRYASLAAIAALTLLGAGCQPPAASPPPLASPPAAEVPVAANVIQIKNFSYEPQTLTVKVGTPVIWTNEEAIVHTVVYDDYINPDAVKFVSDRLAKGQSFNFTFPKPGEYGYHCGIHNSMKGKIVVTE